MPQSQLIPHGLDRLRLLLGLSIIFVICQQSATVGYASSDICTSIIESDICPDSYHRKRDGLCIKSLCYLKVNDDCYPQDSEARCARSLSCVCNRCTNCSDYNHAWKCLRARCEDYNLKKRIPTRFLPWLNRARWQNFSKRLIEPNYEY
ncbi:uncharacterized protein LOC6574456 [Drosophila mojavensis]|uniref:Uncharacterized protein n=1 Tax=Drosophila mojavensis TaxID=7230 RepID=B4KDF4_DROMO|nr:uncharacterized protein LOC6574456 [Drosophila mojavensis]EDW15963.1 uncharacterized protein Dmoj_GI22489 [Drosophila mojavensis]